MLDRTRSSKESDDGADRYQLPQRVNCGPRDGHGSADQP